MEYILFPIAVMLGVVTFIIAAIVTVLAAGGLGWLLGTIIIALAYIASGTFRLAKNIIVGTRTKNRRFHKFESYDHFRPPNCS